MKQIIYLILILSYSLSLVAQELEVEGRISSEGIYMSQYSTSDQVGLIGAGFPRQARIYWTFQGTGGLSSILSVETDATPGSQDTELRFVTAKDDTPSTRVTISSEGNIGIGTTEPDAALHAVGDGIITERSSMPNIRFVDNNNAMGTKDWIIRTNDPHPGDFLIRNESDGTDGLALTSDGDAYVTGDIFAGGVMVLTSDARLKTNIQKIDHALEKVQLLSGIKYDWKNDNPQNIQGSQQIGVIAQEVEKVFPQLVKTDADGYKAVAYPNLTAVLIEAIKDQQNIIESLVDRISRIEAQLDDQ